MSDQNIQQCKANALCVAPPNKGYKQVILQQLVLEIEAETVKAATKYGIIERVIKERQKAFPWINRNKVDYFIKVSKGKTLTPGSITIPHTCTIGELSELTGDTSGFSSSTNGRSAFIGHHNSSSLSNNNATSNNMHQPTNNSAASSDIQLTNEETSEGPSIVEQSMKGG